MHTTLVNKTEIMETNDVKAIKEEQCPFRLIDLKTIPKFALLSTCSVNI